MTTIARSWTPWLAGVLAIALLAIIAPGCAADDAAPPADDEKAAATGEKNGDGDGANAKHEPADAAGHGGEHDADLSHANATANLEKPEEFKYDLAIWTFILFLILLVILLKFAWRPIMIGLEKRENAIAGQIAEAQAANEKAAATLEQYQAKLAAASEEVRGLIAEGKREAEALRDKIVAEAQEAARREQQRAVTEIAAAKNAALGEIAATHVDHAFALARQVVRKEINRDEHGALIRESLERFPSNSN